MEKQKQQQPLKPNPAKPGQQQPQKQNPTPNKNPAQKKGW